jgi:hypothetical protein
VIKINLLSRPRKAKFKAGDVVQHRTSGEAGVVKQAYMQCVAHPFQGWNPRGIGQCRNGFVRIAGRDGEYGGVTPCSAPREFMGSYRLSVGFDKDAEAPERDLEKSDE